MNDHIKNAVFFFFVFAVALYFLKGCAWLNWRTPVFFVGGIFVSALSSLPTYFLKMAVARRISASTAYKAALPYSIAETIYDLGITWGFFSLVVGK